jgi:hypothetical protein
VYAIINSSLFYTYFVVHGDCFHLSDTLVSAFPVPAESVQDERLSVLGAALKKEATCNAEIKEIDTKTGDKISYAEFFGWKSKALIDQIDRRLACLYGFSEEGLDSIVNYSIKYRMGRDGAEQEEAE